MGEAMDKYGLDIQLKKQPPQSPKLNVFDCGIFCSMQKMVTAAAPPTLDELIDVVDKIWKDILITLLIMCSYLFSSQWEIV